MKTFLIDWGADCASGGRYALIQAETEKDAIIDGDRVGWPFKIKELVIPVSDGIRYMEINAPKRYFTGTKFSEIRTKLARSFIE